MKVKQFVMVISVILMELNHKYGNILGLQNRGCVNDMMCTDCDNFNTNVWPYMRLHYKQKHPSVKRPDKFFTREARLGEV